MVALQGVYIPYAQHAAHKLARILSAILCVKACTKGMDSDKMVEMVDGHCSEVRKHVYHSFVCVFDTKCLKAEGRARVLRVYNWSIVSLKVCALCL